LLEIGLMDESLVAEMEKATEPRIAETERTIWLWITVRKAGQVIVLVAYYFQCYDLSILFIPLYDQHLWVLRFQSPSVNLSISLND